MTVRIRTAEPRDSGLILDFMRRLAAYERLSHAVRATADDFACALADPRGPRALIAENDSGPIGFAVYFFNFSTFEGRKGLYLEDLFVSEESRGKGAGKALLAALARIAISENCGRLQWAVLDWNAPSIAFYESLGASPMDDWIMYRLSGPPLAALAEAAA